MTTVRMPWVSANGVAFPDQVPAELRRAWVEAGFCPDRGLYELFAERVAAHPERTAVVDGREALSYRELDDRVRGIAAALAARGVGAGSVVATRLPADRRSPATDLAVAALGAVVLPCVPGHGRRDLAALLGTSRADTVLTAAGPSSGGGPMRLLDDLRGELPHLHRVLDIDALSLPDCRAVPPVTVDPEAPARILVSSGSEAAPKMIAYSHNALAGGRGRYVEQVLRTADGTPPRVLLLVSPATAYGSLAVVALVRCGATVLLREGFDPAGALRAVSRLRPTHLAAVPTMLRRMAEWPPEPDEDLSSLQAVVSSSAMLTPAVLRGALARFGRPLVNVYGSSDGMNCHTRWTDPDGDVLRVGRPDPGVTAIRVCGPDGRELPAGRPGEIQARGPMSPLCHVGAPALDARQRVDGGWVRAGDLGVLDVDGQLRVMSRIKQMVNRGGVSIGTAEVERLLDGHPAVAEAVCVAVPDPDLGERMCACVVPRAAAVGPTLADLTGFLREHCALERHKLPEYLLLLERFPAGSTGKPDRRALAVLAAAARLPVGAQRTGAARAAKAQTASATASI
ncbi:class I adenylate-forming enzyme family protein [Kitasatospora sp. DSM 101779]|uniref:class I adenylate-forming enzyme family protein n=1 Tax=Kitasatospora sp. DSM 101779 TaxID=2853165 RepID=UPI0021D7EDB7|nr:class I adenylate-forming enzyme family protein [Kitasatospora sp. DSM 101779]MCU7826544.1 acyl--CoA ligase [Kitasatospora sp. DSM 101779]